VAPIDPTTPMKTTVASAWMASRRIPVREAIPRFSSPAGRHAGPEKAWRLITSRQLTSTLV
jgi:hypothetical protein